jgi:hypothetical protein
MVSVSMGHPAQIRAGANYPVQPLKAVHDHLTIRRTVRGMLIATLLVTAKPVLCQEVAPQGPAVVFQKLRRATEHVLARYAPDRDTQPGSEHGRVALSIDSSTSTLARRWLTARQAGRGNVPTPYLTTLNRDADALELAATAELVPALRLLKTVDSDLKAKVAFAPKEASASESEDWEVRVVVVATHDGSPMNALTVSWNPARYGRNPNPQFQFNGPTSPSIGMLPPGIYTLWLETAKGELKYEKEHAIGRANAKADTLRVVIP